MAVEVEIILLLQQVVMEVQVVAELVVFLVIHVKVPVVVEILRM